MVAGRVRRPGRLLAVCLLTYGTGLVAMVAVAGRVPWPLVVLLASDLPALTPDAVSWAVHSALRGHVAIVPAPDGGYSLLGSGVALPELEQVPMSRGDTAATLAAAVRRAGRPVHLAPFTVADLDEPQDLPDSWRQSPSLRRAHAQR